MSALPPSMIPGNPQADRKEPLPSALTSKWAELQNAASAVAALAGVQPTPVAPTVDFPGGLNATLPWRRELAERGIEDMAAVMGPGLSALLGIEARGGDPRAAALALWHEFAEARSAILGLTSPA